MGLGIVVEADARHITLHYPAIEEDRIYATSSAPLARIAFQIGDEITNLEQETLEVKAVEEMKGLLYYLADDTAGEERIIPESQLGAQVQLESPTQRLFSGQFDKNRLFELRAATLHYRHVQQKSEARGLIGSRTSLLPHQVYIAHQVANRYAPRVLLADEVGLGKTIEAGMILHHQLETGMSSRCLIVVPEPLLHQWLVEMLRKFNLHFSLFDEQRYNDLLEAGEPNPFETEQLILCSMSLLTSTEQVGAMVTSAEWDITVIDEAHHLEWHADSEPSPAYKVTDALAKRSNGLLLLTATPEQVGVESHFARLRLLDPTRFHDLDAFKEEQQGFVELNQVVTKLDSAIALDSDEFNKLQALLGNDSPSSADEVNGYSDHERQHLINQLLDCHGTGRVLLRNTRAAIEDFPVRVPIPYPLETPADYTRCDLQSENNHSDWLDTDPRVKWLENLLTDLKREKVLLICGKARTALDLEKHLHLDIGIRSTAFHEGLSIVERDRAAAYFADDELGAQVMICSEIGSEGRNFQFAHHLVLFDLPLNPDLLEQRIGRLDRIGQTQDIKIHIPYMQGTSQEYLYRWYNEGVNAFSQSFSAGHAVFEHFADRLLPWIDNEQQEPKEDFATLLSDTARHREQLQHELEEGRDHLLELNSCNHSVAENVIDSIYKAERSELCLDYMSRVFDNFGVEQEYHSPECWVIRPTEQMLTEEFPHLKEEGMTITYNRNVAQKREDMAFITWEHPMVTDAIDLVLSNEIGNNAIGAVKIKALPPGSVLLEVFYSMQCSAPKHLHLDRYLPATPVRVLMEASGKDLTNIIKHTQLNQLREHLKRSSRFAIIKQVKPQLEKMLEKSESIARQKALPLIDSARQAMHESLGGELERLKHLKSLNNTIRDDELAFFEHRISEAEKHFDLAVPEMQAVRVIVNTYQK